jgi:hypothetical protein
MLGGALYGVVEGAVVSIADYSAHKAFLKRYGYLPLQPIGLATLRNEEIDFGEAAKKRYSQVPELRYQLIKEVPAMVQIGQGENRDAAIQSASLEAWAKALAADLAKHKIGKKAKPKKAGPEH